MLELQEKYNTHDPFELQKRVTDEEYKKVLELLIKH